MPKIIQLSAKQMEKKKKELTCEKLPEAPEFHIGIEVECYLPNAQRYNELMEFFIMKGIDKYCEFKDDGSIHPPDEDEEDEMTTLEICMVAKESEFYGVLNLACQGLNQSGAMVNKTCGLHVHIDARHKDINKVFNNLVVFQDILFSMCPRSRRGNIYCRPTQTRNLSDFLEWAENVRRDHDYPEGFWRDNPRYSAINGCAAEKYKSIEIRLHSGTVDHTKIENWIKLLNKIGNSPVMFERPPATMTEMVKVLKLEKSLADYVKERITKFNPNSPFLGRRRRNG